MLRSLRSGDLDVALTVYIVPKDFEGLSLEELVTYPLRLQLTKSTGSRGYERFPSVRLPACLYSHFLEANILGTKYYSRNYFYLTVRVAAFVEAARTAKLT